MRIPIGFPQLTTLCVFTSYKLSLLAVKLKLHFIQALLDVLSDFSQGF